MLLQFSCPAGHALSVPESLSGRRVRCPKCGRPARVPDGKQAEADIKTHSDSDRSAADSAGADSQGASSKAASSKGAPKTARAAEKSAPLAERGKGPDGKGLSADGASAARPTPPPVPKRPPPVPPTNLPEKPTSQNHAPQSAAQRKPLPKEPVPSGRPAATGGSEPAVLAGAGRTSEAESPPGAIPANRPERYSRSTVYWLGAGLTLLCLVHLAPVFNHLNLALAPNWARIVLAITLVELAYVVWMVTVPDWSTVWTAMIVFALVAAVYGAALALTVMTPRTTSMLFDLDENRDAARLWCTAMVVLTSGMTYVTGSIGYKWRKAHRSGQ